VSFDAVTVSVGDGDEGDAGSREFDVEFSRPERTRDERLADLWSELREET